jgi:hypothetical protein
MEPKSEWTPGMNRCFKIKSKLVGLKETHDDPPGNASIRVYVYF